MKTETPAASTEVLYVKPSGLFVTGGRGMCVCVSALEEERGMVVEGVVGGKGVDQLPARQ